MDREKAKQQIRASWRSIIPTMTAPAKTKVNGETSWICPLCGHGAHGDGLTLNPQSKDGLGLKCFGCDFAGDIIDLYQRTTGADYNTALISLAAIIGLEIDRTERATSADSGSGNTTEAPPAAKSPQDAKNSPTEAAADYTEYYLTCQRLLVDSAAADYLKVRGISIETARNFGIGFDPQADPANAPGAMANEYKPHPCPRLIIPCTPAYYVARRIDDSAEFKAPNPKGSSRAMFNEQALYAQNVQEVFIAEGWADALSIAEAGAAAIALNSANNATALLDLLQEHPTAATMIICADRDNAGSRSAKLLRDGFARLHIPFIEADLNGGGKDPNDGLTTDRGAFFEAVADAVQEARKTRERIKEQALQDEMERQRRTGAGMVDSFLEAVKTRKYEPIPTGIMDIDRALGGGFMRQWLVLLGAPPGAGKTAMAQWIFEGMARRGTTCLYLNLEMSREQMLARSLSRIAAQNGEHIKPVEVLQGYKWDAAQEAIVMDAADKFRTEIAPQLIYLPDGITSSLDSIMEYAEAEAARAEAADLPAPILVLDYLQVVTGGQREDKIDLIQRTIATLKGYAIKHNTVVFAITAQNREANRTGISGMESGRDTSNIEYGADLLLGLDYTKCLPRNGQKGKSKDDLTPEEMNLKTLKINKGRFTAPGAQVDLLFNGETMTFNQLLDPAANIEPPPMRTRRS